MLADQPCIEVAPHVRISVSLTRLIFGIWLLQCGRDPKPVLTRLWTHENMRVFQDRLVDNEDRAYLKRLLHALLKSRFDTKLSCEVSSAT